MNVARLSNKYLTERRHGNSKRPLTRTADHTSDMSSRGQLLVLLARLLQTAAKIAAAFGVSARWRTPPPTWFPRNNPRRPALLFSVGNETVAAVAKLGQKSATSDSSARDVMPTKDEITFDDFTKLDFRVEPSLNAKRSPRPTSF